MRLIWCLLCFSLLAQAARRGDRAPPTPKSSTKKLEQQRAALEREASRRSLPFDAPPEDTNGEEDENWHRIATRRFAPAIHLGEALNIAENAEHGAVSIADIAQAEPQ